MKLKELLKVIPAHQEMLIVDDSTGIAIGSGKKPDLLEGIADLYVVSIEPDGDGELLRVLVTTAIAKPVRTTVTIIASSSTLIDPRRHDFVFDDPEEAIVFAKTANEHRPKSCARIIATVYDNCAWDEED